MSSPCKVIKQVLRITLAPFVMIAIQFGQASAETLLFEVNELADPAQAFFGQLNDNGEAGGSTVGSGDNPATPAIWLPRPAYGLATGFHAFSQGAFPHQLISVRGFNNAGQFAGFVHANDRRVTFRWSPLEPIHLSNEFYLMMNDHGWLVSLSDENLPVFDDGASRTIISSDIFPHIASEFGEIPTPVAINNEGQVLMSVRKTELPAERGAVNHQTLAIWKNGRVSELPVFRRTSGVVQAYDINDHGEVVGFQDGASWIHLPQPAYGLPAGKSTISNNFSPLMVNNAGQILLSTQKQIWQNGELFEVGLASSTGSWAISSLTDLNNVGQLLAVLTQPAQPAQQTYAILTPQRPTINAEISISPSESGIRVKDNILATIKVTSNSPDTQTITFADPLLAEEPPMLTGIEDASLLTVGQMDLPPPFELTPENPSRSFAVPVTVRKSGLTSLESHLTASDEEGNTEEILLQKPVTISPLEVTIITTPRELILNQTPARLKSPDCPPNLANCVEIKVTIKNTSDRTVKNVNIPAATNILSMITSADLEEPGVPLTPVKFTPPAGTSEAPEFVTLEKNGKKDEKGRALDTTTYVWHLDATDAPATLDVKVLALGTIDGTDVRGLGIKRLKLIDKPLLRWGINPSQGQIDFRSGQPVRVNGFIENVSKDSGEERDLVVLVYQTHDGNLGGGYMQKAAELGTRTPEYYNVFELPPGDDERLLNLGSVFSTLPLYENSTGTVSYGIRLWVKDKESGKLTNADSQVVLAEDWLDEYDVRLSKNDPPPDTYVDECLQAGIPAEICGISEGLYFVAGEGVAGLVKFSVDGWNDLRVLAPQVATYNLWLVQLTWKALQNDQRATRELLRETYGQYVEFVNLGVMAGEAGSRVPMVFDAFVAQGVTAFDNFIRDIATGDLTNARVKVGKFIGSNPDMLLEPLLIARTYSKLSRSLKSASDDLGEDVIQASMRQQRERQAVDRDTRIARADADPNVTDLSTALRAGDELPDSLLARIFGVSAADRRALENFCRTNKVIVTFRPRHPRSLVLLDATPPKAYPKPKAMKWKTVNDIDAEYLGYRKDALATVQIVEPPAGMAGKSGDELKRAVADYMDVLKNKRPELKSNPVLADEVRIRLTSRVKEWNKQSKNLDLQPTKTEAEIGVNFGTNAQSTHDLVEQVGVNDLRKLSTDPIEGAEDLVTGRPRRTWEVKMDGPNGAEPLPIAGDIDFLAILDQNGMFIKDDNKRINMYRQLAEIPGMQHGESYAFRLQDMRAEFLRCCTEGKQAMATIGPWPGQSPTAGHFVDNLSVMDSGPNSAFRRPRQNTDQSGDSDVLLREGEFVTARHADPSGEFPLINGMPQLLNVNYAFRNRFRPLIYEQLLEEFTQRLPFYFPGILSRFFRKSQGEDPLPSGKEPDPAFTRDGPVLQVVPVDPDRLDGPVIYRVWDEEEGWRTVDINEAIELTGGDLDQLKLAPVTSMPEGAKALDTIINITPKAELVNSGAFFEPGDRIVLNPGGENEEFATVTALGSLVLSKPLKFDHEPGEMIALAPAPGGGGQELDSDGDGYTDAQENQLGTDPNDPASFFRITSVTTGPDRSLVILAWPSVPGNTYTVESSTNLRTGSWTAVSTVPADEGASETVAIDFPPAGSETRYYRIRLGSRDL